MIIYETGMTDQEFIACLMEMEGEHKISLRMLLSPSEYPKINAYRAMIQQDLTRRKLNRFDFPKDRLHLSITGTARGGPLAGDNLKRELDRFQPAITLPYLDTNTSEKDKMFLVIEFELTRQLMEIRKRALALLNIFGLKEPPNFSYSPHMTIGHDAEDTPEQIVTENPGFSEVAFSGIDVSAIKLNQPIYGAPVRRRLY